MKRGQAIPQDWTVILGTLSPCDANVGLLYAVFSEFPNYDEEKTAHNLKQLKDRYYPASFGYLYYIYDLEIEEELDPEMTGFEYLCQHLGISAQTTASMTTSNRVKDNGQLSIEDTINKEKEYLLYNDESPDIYIWNQLNLLKMVGAGASVVVELVATGESFLQRAGHPLRLAVEGEGRRGVDGRRPGREAIAFGDRQVGIRPSTVITTASSPRDTCSGDQQECL